MSDSEVKPENKTSSEGNEEVDIYSDVLSDQDSLIVKLKEKVDKLGREKELLLKSLSSLQKNYEELRKECGELKEKFKVVSFNSSSLFKTAQAEIKRKDRLINELRKEKDDLVFRKSSVNQSLQRSRKCAVLSPRKQRSPIKKPNMVKSIPSLESPRPTRVPLIESENPRPSSKGPSEELESSRSTKRPSVENNSDTTVSGIQVGKESLEPVELPSNNKYSAPKPSISNKAKPIPPPFKGPSTAYSRRLYKRIHGVSPPKSDISVIKDELPENTKLKLKFTSEETEATKSDCKVETITSKLQKDVQEIIKLGSPSKTSPPLTTKLSPEKQKQYITPIKDDTPKQNTSKPIAEKLIIQCDLRNTLKESQQNSQNFVSINETIDNILKKQRAGLYSPHANVVNNIKDEEPKKESLDSNPTSKTTNRLLTNLNKRATDKLTISPATFGKLVAHSAKSRPDVTPPSKEILDKSPIETKSESRKRKLSEMLPSENKTSPQDVQRPRQDTYPKTIKKTKFISSLFGESPMKFDVKSNQEIQPKTSKNPISLRTPSPSERVPHPSSPIFPDSPSLESDNNEELIIDTTACSQNTSARVSESDQKNVDEIDETTLVKLNVGLNNKSESQAFSQDAEAKQSAIEVDNLANSGISDERKACTISNNSNEDKNNSLTVNKIIDNQEEKGSTISLPQITVICRKIISEEEISECPPASNEQNKPSDPNNSNHPKAGEDNLRNLHLETSHSSASLDKVSSPEKSSEFQSFPPSDNKDTILSNNKKEEFPVARFIPSPPQLTLVSAFKHSENSVFALAEDTLGFVSALTRMRDISPIRTPDKKSKLFNRPLSQTQQSESASHRESEALMNNSFEFLKPLDQDFQNNSSSLSVGLNKIDKASLECCKLNNPPSAEPAPSCSLTPLAKAEKEDKDSQKDGTCKTNTTDSVQYVKDKSQKSRNQDQQRDIEKVLETSKTIKPYHDNGNVSNSKKMQSPTHNPFRRTKPVQRITTENKVKSELSTTYNIQPTTMQTKQKDSSKAQEIFGKDNLEKMDVSDNTNKSVKEMDTHRIELGKLTNKQVVEKLNSGKVLEELTNLEQDTNLNGSTVKLIGVNVAGSTVVSGEIISNGVNECPTKDLALSSLVSTNSDAIKTFKRSESLKMVQKPLPRNYLNIMKNIEAKKSEDVFEMSIKKTQRFEEFATKEGKLSSKSDFIKDNNKSSELNQISHIANINKKLRVSKHQIKPEKENLYQLKLSETVMNSDKSSNNLSDEKNIAQSSLIKENNIVSSGKVRENKIKPHSTSLNLSHQRKRRNDRRSVSLGPEIRLGIQINLPPIHKNKQRITASNYCSKDPNNVEPVEKTGESIFMKNSPKEVSEISFRKSDDNSRKENISKVSVFQKDSRITTSNNLNSEGKILSQSKRSSSPSPRRHKIPQKCNIKSKSPDMEKTNPRGWKRSLSRSPDCKRSRSNHKVSLRKSPDYERRNRHSLSRSCSRSPDHNRSKNSRTYSPRRTVSGGRSRRSRYDDYRRRSPSPDYRRHKFHEKEHRNRSSHYKYKYRSDRSRDRSSDPKHRNIEERPRHKSRNCSRRSRSSSSHSHDKSLRNCSPSRQKSDSHMTKNINQFIRKYPNDDAIENTSLPKDADGKLDKHSEENSDGNTILSYKEELETMRKEIEMLKGRVKISEEITPKDSSAQSINNSVEHGLQYSSEDVKCVELSLNKIVEVVKTNMSIKNDKMDSNIRMITKEPELSQTNSAKSLHKPCYTPGQDTSKENTQSTNKSSTDNTGSKRPSTDNAGSKTPSTDTGSKRLSTDNAGSKTPSTDNAGSKTPSTDNAGSKRPSTDNAGSKTPSTDNAGSKTPSTDNAGSKTPSTDSGPTLLPQEKPKPIKIKRRVRRLGDSEVQVVSIK